MTKAMKVAVVAVVDITHSMTMTGMVRLNASTEAEQKELAQQLDQAGPSGCNPTRLRSGSARLNRELGELLPNRPRSREPLGDFVTTTCAGKDYSTWKRPSRRFIGMDVLMPSSISESVGEIVVGIDTSGSIGNDELNSFLTEIVGYLRPSQTKQGSLTVLGHTSM